MRIIKHFILPTNQQQRTQHVYCIKKKKNSCYIVLRFFELVVYILCRNKIIKYFSYGLRRKNIPNNKNINNCD